MIVAFLNENTLGHTSYLPRFAAELRRRPELGIEPRLLDALPLPHDLARMGDTSIRGLRKFGLDFHSTRWRIATSRHLRRQLDALRQRETVDAVVLNTQSMGLELAGLDRSVPVFVGLDATFQQLAASPWFAPNLISRCLQPLTLTHLLQRERALFSRTDRFLPWSVPVKEALIRNYGIPASRVSVLPPSMTAPPRRSPKEKGTSKRSRLLFVGGDFLRKGGELLQECHRRYLADRCDLVLVTQSEIAAGPHQSVRRGLIAGSGEWRECWETADVFVFPSRLETFGIVLLEALAFEVPIVSSRAGAAVSLLGDGRFGTLLESVSVESLRESIRAVLESPDHSGERSRQGREWFESEFELGRNTERLAGWLHGAAGMRR
jgi:hypothetical protein